MYPVSDEFIVMNRYPGDLSCSKSKELGVLNGHEFELIDSDFIYSESAALILAISSIAFLILGFCTIMASALLGAHLLAAGGIGIVVAGSRFLHEMEGYDDEVAYHPWNGYPPVNYAPINYAKEAFKPSEPKDPEFRPFISKHFDVKEVKGNGDCLFNSLNVFFEERPPAKIREEICDFMDANWDYFKKSNHLPKTEVLASMRRSGTWGGQVEIMAFVGLQAAKGEYVQVNVFCDEYPLPSEAKAGRVLQPIETCIHGPGMPKKYGKPADPLPEGAVVRVINLRRTNNNHYDALIPKATPSLKSPSEASVTVASISSDAEGHTTDAIAKAAQQAALSAGRELSDDSASSSPLGSSSTEQVS